MGGSIVRGEDHKGVLSEVVLIQSFQNGADVFIEVGDHGRVTGPGSGMRKVAILASIDSFLLIPFFRVMLDPFPGRVHGDVWFDKGAVEKEGPGPVIIEKLQGLGEDAVGGVGLRPVVISPDLALRFTLVTGDRLLVDSLDSLVIVEKGREKRVGVSLAVVAIEAVKSLANRGTARVGGSQSPLAEAAGSIASFPEGFRDGNRLCGDGPLSGKLPAVS